MTARSRARLVAALSAGLALLLSACSKTNLPQDSLNPAGPVARTEDRLFWPVFVIAVVVFILVEGLLVVAVVKFRHRPGRQQPVQVHGNRRLEVTWTVIPALILLGVAVPTVGTIFSLARRPPNALQITVTGHQWWWQVEYPGMHVVTANEVHIPAGQPVYLTLESVDVIHSFWVPRLAGKQDLEPGRTNHLTIEAFQPGLYLGQCAEFCGASHANMRFRVIAQSPADFQSWVTGQQQAVAEPAAGSLAAQGKQLFEQGQFPGGPACVACHSVGGAGAPPGLIGPNLTHFASRTTFAGSTLDNTPAQVAQWLHDPPALKPGSDMPNLGLTRDQIDALVAYLEGLK